MNKPIERPNNPSSVPSSQAGDPKRGAEARPSTSPKAGAPAPRPDAATPAAPTSKPMQQAMPGGDALKGKWQQQVGAAKLTWGKLTDDELLQLEGQEQKLAGLVQERYAISRDEAARQARAFFATHMS